MMGEALSLFQRTWHRTKQSNATQQFLPLDVAHLQLGDCSNRMLLSPTGKSAEEITWPCMQAAMTLLQQRWILINVHMGTCAAGGGLGWSAEQERPATAR